jgi:hypothetical protein
MANPEIEIGINTPDPEDCPSTFTELVALLEELLHAELIGSYVPYVTGAETPSVDDQDKVWHRQDVSGRPIGTFVYYSGAWRREYTGNLGEVVMYSGDPAVDFAGTDGLGTVGGNWDGWALCNGDNGTPNLSDKFIVGAKMDDLTVGYSSGWKTGVSGSTTDSGGVNSITLDDTNTYRPAHDAVEVRRWEADGNTPNVAGSLYGVGTGVTLLPADAGNETPPAIPTLPNYYTLALVQFIGYA